MDEQWSIVEPLLLKAIWLGRRRRISLRAVMDAIFYLLRTGCQPRQLPSEFPPWSMVYWYFGHGGKAAPAVLSNVNSTGLLDTGPGVRNARLSLSWKANQ
jgi:transposase